MLSGEGNENENGGKTTMGLIAKKQQKKKKRTFLCCCFARLQRETSINFLVKRFMKKRRTCSFTFFFAAAHFHRGGR